jgi:hypothetical protein
LDFGVALALGAVFFIEDIDFDFGAILDMVLAGILGAAVGAAKAGAAIKNADATSDASIFFKSYTSFRHRGVRLSERKPPRSDNETRRSFVPGRFAPGVKL